MSHVCTSSRYLRSTKTTYEKYSLSIKAFLASLTLTHLILLGFRRDILIHAIEYTGSSLRSLSSHIRESAFDLSMRYGSMQPGLVLASILLSGEDVAIIKAACPSLGCINVDVLASSLPMADQDVPATTPQVATASSKRTSTPSDLDTRWPPLPSLSPHRQPLLSIPILQSLSLFIHKHDARREDNPYFETAAGIIKLYNFLRGLRPRPGCFPDVSISSDVNGGVMTWKVRKEKTSTVTVEQSAGRRLERQVWDLNCVTRVEERGE